MATIVLPISKSIANRLLLLQAIHGDSLLRVSSDMPDDILVLHDALEQLQTFKQGGASNSQTLKQVPLVLNLKNCGTALRFLQVHLERFYPDVPITLTGDPRLMERDGKPTTQTTSARILHGDDIPVSPNESPYIKMSRIMAESYRRSRSNSDNGLTGVAGLTTLWSAERDWSAAAFWYEYIAIHGGELLLEDLTPDSLQGDRIVADIYAQHFNVETTFTPAGAIIKKSQITTALPIDRNHKSQIAIDFVNCIDLYPAVALTCEKLSIELHATGTDRLRFKESDRLEAVRLHEVRNDHRIAMALMAADYPVSESDQKCIVKSYPGFVQQYVQMGTVNNLLHTAKRRQKDGNETATKANVTTPSITHITPVRGVNDDNLGKKHALSKLIHAATTDYLWLHDDDVILPKATNNQLPITKYQSDLIILPLRMESNSLLSGRGGVGLLEKLQIAEYAAIQELTMRTAKQGRAVMCSGANLIVKREVWLACESELHPEIPSGDDMFLLEAAKRHGYKIGVIDEPDYTAVVRPQTSWRAFFRQRMRWAGKAPHYTDRDIIRCGRWVVFVNLLQILCPLIIFVKFPIEYSLIKKREPRTSWYVALLLEIIYPFYLFVSLLCGLFRTNRW